MTDLPRLARWLGPEYNIAITRRGEETLIRMGDEYPLDDDQLLGAILRRAAERGLEPSLTYRGAAGWRYSIRLAAGYSIEHGPTPLSAALAAVEELTKETQDGR